MAHVFGLVESAPQDSGISENPALSEGDPAAGVYEGSVVDGLEDLFSEDDGTGVNFGTSALHSAVLTDSYQAPLKPTQATSQHEPDSGTADQDQAANCSQVDHNKQQAHADNEVKSVRRRNHTLMVDEVTCSVCMDIMVHATALNPCGHTFCHSCVHRHRVTGIKAAVLKGAAPVTNCPNCRQPINSVFRMTMLDNIILSMLKRGDFQVDDASEFLKRADILLTEQELQSVLRGGLPPVENEVGNEKKRLSFPNSEETMQNHAKKIRRTNPCHAPAACTTFSPQIIDLSWRHTASQPLVHMSDGGGATSEDPICLD